jgi:cytochrome P450
LYHLAADPEYASVLREEVNAVVAEHGWTKAAIDRMYKIDSFLRESLRINTVVSSEKLHHLVCLFLADISSVSMLRVAMKDFTFSDGMRIPAGTYICVPIHATHHDDQKYTESSKFDPKRFIPDDHWQGNADEKDVEHRQQQTVTASPDYLAWGLGRHSWYVIFGRLLFYFSFFISPGRWFAATELKTMLAHLVVTYDVKLKEEGRRPPNEWIGATCLPNRSAQVLFRKCQA